MTLLRPLPESTYRKVRLTLAIVWLALAMFCSGALAYKMADRL